MQLDQKVLSYELSKKLVEKGIVLDTEFYWWESETDSKVLHKNDKDNYLPGMSGQVAPAPLLVEMLEVIERLIKADKIQQIDITLREERKEIYYFYGEYEREAEGETVIEKTAQTLLHLLENGHITLEDINTNL